ncbi:hypothetical protein AB0C21_29015 [Spirillospora sp. NPDC049024]
MTAVVLVGDFPSTGILQATVAQRVVAEGPGGEGAPAFIDHMAHALRQRGAVLVLYPAWKKGRAERLVRLARSALLTDRIAGLSLDVPPLALSLIADQLMFASAYARPGVLASLGHRLCETVHAGAWVNSVARLEHIKTGLGAHVSSYLPGGGFAVTAGAHPEVHRITASKPVPQLASRPVDPVLLLVADANGDAEWLQSKMRPVLAAVSSTAVAPQPMSAEYWGTKKYTEFVAFSGHPQALQSLLAGSRYRACGWCGEPIALPECPFCLMVQPTEEASPAGHVPPGHHQPSTHPVQPAESQPRPPQPPAPQPPQPPAPQHQAPAPQQAQPSAAPPQPSWPETPPAPEPQPVRPPQGPPDHSEAPPTRPQYPNRFGGGSPSAPPPGGQSPWGRSERPDATQAVSPEGEEPRVPARKEPVLAAPVETFPEAAGDTDAAQDSGLDGPEDDRTRIQAPPGSWGRARPSGTHRTGEAGASGETAESSEPADTNARPIQTEDPPSISTLLNDAAPRRAAAPDSPPERTPRTTPDDEWRTGTVVFRRQHRQ